MDKEFKDVFRNWHEEVTLLQELRIPRWACGDEKRGDVIYFHVFVDASRDAYAAVLYARTEASNGVKVQLIEAKARVAPMGKSTIPRLELLAATIGARLMTFTLDALDKSQAERRFWSDSSTVLSWIKRGNQWATFIWNRVKEIRQLSEPEQWYHVPGSMNPADLPSRGCSARQLLESKWWEGPEWLRKSCDQWPSADYTVDENEVGNEVKKSTINKKKPGMTVHSNFGLSNSNLTVPDPEYYWYLQGFFKYSKVVRMMAWMLRFVSRCRGNRSLRQRGVLTVK